MSRELDQAVAEKVMGWTWELTKFNGDRRILVADRSWGDRSWVGMDVLEYVPHYSTDIAAAWLVAEKLEQTVAAWSIGKTVGVEGYTCMWFKQFGHPWDEVVAPTASEAICLAALKAVGERI
jgi:hypothetical protein